MKLNVIFREISSLDKIEGFKELSGIFLWFMGPTKATAPKRASQERAAARTLWGAGCPTRWVGSLGGERSAGRRGSARTAVSPLHGITDLPGEANKITEVDAERLLQVESTC